MDDWVDPKQPYGKRKSLFRAEYNALGKRNLAAIHRIVSSKCQRGAAFNRQHPFVDVLLITPTTDRIPRLFGWTSFQKAKQTLQNWHQSKETKP
jgi:hypothetical protein